MDNTNITPLTTASQTPLTVNDVIEVTESFPIGNRVNYFPEYQTQMTMQSIILGYEINGKILFRQNQLETLATKHSAHLVVHMPDKEYEFAEIQSFCILLPAKAGEEGKLNYPSKASLGNLGQFRNGNSITLTARYENSGVVIVESTVRESLIPKEGVYRNHRIAMLEVLAKTLEFKEQRTHHRLRTNVPVQLEANPLFSGDEAFLVDYSELSVQIELPTDSRAFTATREGQRINFTLKLDKLQRTFVIGGQIMRKSGDRIIVTMQEFLEGANFRNFELMDALDVKACLLQQPSTR